MNNNLPDEMKIACCKTCLLAENMRDCKSCPFNVGLVVKGLERLGEVLKAEPVKGSHLVLTPA